jgi:hypothetical protein
VCGPRGVRCAAPDVDRAGTGGVELELRQIARSGADESSLAEVVLARWTAPEASAYPSGERVSPADDVLSYWRSASRLPGQDHL